MRAAHLAFLLESKALSFDCCLTIPPHIKEDEGDQEHLPEQLRYFKDILFLSKVKMIDPNDRNGQHHATLKEYCVFVLNDLHTKVSSEGLEEHNTKA